MWSMLPSRVLARTCSVILLIVLGHQLGGIIFGQIKIILIDFDHCSCPLFGAERERERDIETDRQTDRERKRQRQRGRQRS